MTAFSFLLRGWRQSIRSEHGSGAAALILVVERDEQVRELESYFLRRAGFAVDFASDGEEALELARVRRPEVIITEILVPRIDGLALCRRIKRDPELQRARVLVLSILSASVRAREAGADAFLRKPLGERALLEAVERLLDVAGAAE